MKFEGFEITTDFVSTICKKDRQGKRKYVSGYLCRIYLESDEMHKRVLDEFYAVPDYNEELDPDWEVTAAIEYVDNNQSYIVDKSLRIDSERAYSILRMLCKNIYDTHTEEEIIAICNDMGVSTNEFYTIIENYDKCDESFNEYWKDNNNDY